MISTLNEDIIIDLMYANNKYSHYVARVLLIC